MIKDYIFLGDKSEKRCHASNGIEEFEYSYNTDSGMLTVWFRDRVICSRHEVEPGSAFTLIENGEDSADVIEMHMPTRPGDFLMYILGFGRGFRHNFYKHYQRALGDQMKSLKISDSDVTVLKGEHYELAVYDDGDYCHKLSGFIDSQVTNEAIKEILEKWHYHVSIPWDYLRYSFKKRFSMTDDDIDIVFYKWE